MHLYSIFQGLQDNLKLREEAILHTKAKYFELL